MNKNYIFFVIVALLKTAPAFGQSICVFDPLGAQGDNYSMLKDYALIATQWGANLELKPFSDEHLATESFKSGKCDGVAISGIRARQFNNFAGSIDSVRGVVTEEAYRLVLDLMANPKLNADMMSNGTEVAGISPLGFAYVITNSKNLNTMQSFYNKRFGVLSYDKAQSVIVDKIGAIPVSLELSQIGSAFNMGRVDAVELPALAFKPLELGKGVGSKGAIVKFPIGSITYDLLINPEKFPMGYGQKSRLWFASEFDRQMSNVHKIESAINKNYWIDLSESEVKNYDYVLRLARVSLTKQDVYNKKMMHILKNVRCNLKRSESECLLNDE